MHLLLEGIKHGIMIGFVAFIGILITIELIVGKEVSPIRLVYKHFKDLRILRHERK
jgi:hypothetical protein